jgi:thymidine phosphorylase
VIFVKELLARKRDGGTLAEAEIAALVAGITDGSLTEGQVAAFAMAVCCRGMSAAECAALTRAMTRSGTVLAWPGGLPVLDKHSTGGVGDKTSLMIAPILAACGAQVPMIAGRGLGHSGGTLDKLDAIPGYVTQPDLARFRRAVAGAGCAIVGQTDDLAPADRRLYAVRDTTGTVESIPLITASILSKKLAAGLQGLVMDVKFGSGAFMRRPEDTEALARSLVATAGAAGLPVTALLTDMNEVLGDSAGNALETAEAIAFLTGARREPRLDRVTRALAAEALLLGGLAQDAADAATRIAQALDSGAAAERFARMVAALGGPHDLLERSEALLPQATVTLPVLPARPGFVAAVDAKQMGLAVLVLGGGRYRPDDVIDYAVGFDRIAPIGAEVGPDRPLALLRASDRIALEPVIDMVREAVTIADAPPPERPLILQRIAGDSPSSLSGH